MPKDSLKIFDINLKLHYYTKEVIERSLERADILKINDEEVVKIAQLFGWNAPEKEVCKQLLEKYHLDVLILTKELRDRKSVV